MTTYVPQDDGDVRYAVAEAAQVSVCGPCYDAGRTVLATHCTEDPPYGETRYYCNRCAPGGATALCGDCQAAANPETGYCARCEAVRGIPPSLRLTPAQAYAVRVVAPRDLDRR